MKIAIVNDMTMAIETLRRALAGVPDFEIAWVARDGAEAVQHCAKNRPDLVLMDLLMPVMDGVEATRRIMAQSPCAILVVTGTVDGNISKVFDAMGCGALDAVCTPVLGMHGDLSGAEPLLAKIKTIRVLLTNKATQNTPSAVPQPVVKRESAPLVVIGASTGGPQALADVFAALPAGFAPAIVIVQHVDKLFAPGLAEWLSLQSRIPVQLIAPGDRPLPGKALMANTNDHLILNKDLTFSYTREPVDYPYRPSVDVLFESVVQCYPGKHTAVLLTGMGRDGAKGLLSLRQRNWHTIAQDEKSSVVYGMPKAALELQAACEVLPLKHIGRRLGELAGGLRRGS